MLKLTRQLAILALALLACFVRGGGEFMVNQTTVLDQERPVLAQLTNGTLVAAWESETGAVSSIWLRRFSTAGASLGAEQLVFQAAGLDQSSPSLAALSDGRFVIGWSRSSDCGPAGPGGNQPHNNLQPYLTLSFIIALQGTYPPRS